MKPDESLLITADTASDMAVVDAVLTAASLAGAKPMVSVIPQLPFQGKLADPYIPSALGAAMRDTDAWIDLTHPFLIGSDAHAQALKTNRLRCLGAGGMDAPALCHLYGMVDLDRLYEVQQRVDALIVGAAGKECRVTDPLGTAVSFVLAKSTQGKTRRAERPGMNTVPGSAVLLPEIDSVRGTIRLVAAMHEYYAPFAQPMTVTVDGRISGLVEGGPDAQLMDRALRRAGGGDYGHVIHFSYGFHPAARFGRGCFIEDIRVTGANAIGFGEPWWKPGGGENHPDGVVLRQSLEIEGERIITDGILVGPPELAERAAALVPLYH
ncbi:MAG: hypothetical protein WDO24_07840 [Pseudomonadota bacterium]